jgi:cytochrome d ubiquinol oxidase subunit II
MELLWFGIVVAMTAAYVVMDGFDFGAGILHLRVAQNDRERRQVLAAIGPFWDGNEVWLLAAGGVLFLAFPKVLAAGLSGLYLAIMLVLWVLILRGISIEFRSHLADSMWRSFWDGVFVVASTLAPLLLGTALGNLVRGVPLDVHGWFALPLFDSFSPSGTLGILDWYTTLSGLLALVAIAHHGALYLTWKTDGAVSARARAWAARLFPLVIAVWIAAGAATTQVAPELFAAATERPLVWLATLLAVVGIVTSARHRRAGRDLAAFLGSSAFLLGILVATAAASYPTMLKSATDPRWSLSAIDSAAHSSALASALWWLPAGLVLAIVYCVVLFRLHRGKAQPSAEGEGY